MLKNNLNEDINYSVSQVSELFDKALELYEKNDYVESYSLIAEAHKRFLEINSLENVSICLSFMGLLKYMIEPQTYYKCLLILEDAKYLANTTSCEFSGGVNRYAFSQVVLKEGNIQEALLYLNRADSMLDKCPYLKLRTYESLAYVNLELKNFEKAYYYLNKGVKLAQEMTCMSSLDRLSIIHNSLQKQNEEILAKPFERNNSPSQPGELPSDPMLAMLKIPRTISAEIDLDTLLTTIAEQTRLVLNADRCTVFLIDKEKNELWSRIALGIGSEEIRFPIDKGLAGHVALSGETINIQNAYTDSRFNKEIDIQTGYKTNNILCMPIRNIKYEIIGVFQVLNKFNGDFTNQDEDLLVTIGSNAGIALENNILFNRQQKMLEEQKALFSSFIDTLAASIDARDKITSGHSSRVRMYAEIISKELKIEHEKIQSISKAALLHDIGKIGIRDSVLQKEGRLTPEEYDHIKTHVEITHDILSKISTSKSFEDVVDIASSHHEKFDGTGYFRGLSGENIPVGGRILAVADVFDAITSVRHYRDKMPIKNAIDILIQGMNAHFDKMVVDAFLSISCDRIIDIFLTEYDTILNQEHRTILSNYSMMDLYNLITDENKGENETGFIHLFESYYINKSVITN